MKKLAPYMLVASIALLAYFFGIDAIHKYVQDQRDTVAKEYEDILVKERAENSKHRDSLNYRLHELKDSNELLNKELIAKSADYDNVYSSYQNYKKAVVIGNRPKVITIDKCDSVVESCNQYVDVLISSLDNCNDQIVIYDSIVSTYRKDSLMNVIVEADMKKHINQQLQVIVAQDRKINSFWNKNKFWIGVISGAVISTTGIMLAK